MLRLIPVSSFTEDVNSRLAKGPLQINGRLADLELTSLVKEDTGIIKSQSCERDGFKNVRNCKEVLKNI